MIERNTDQTKVIFRVWRKGRKFNTDVIALFPTDPGTNDPRTCSSYEHVGQHGSADPAHVMSLTRPATAMEYDPLRRELESIGYNLLIVNKQGPKDFAIRNRQIS